MIVFFDIETTPNLDIVDLLPEPTAPGNYKDAAKIAEYIAEKQLEQVARMALDPDFCKVKSIALKEGDGEIEYRAGDEREMIEWFWSASKRNFNQLCGYNIIGFDLPVLMRRSFELDIKPPTVFTLSKYHPQVIDLMGILFNWNGFKGFKWVCKRYGIKLPAEGVDGSMVDSLTPEQLEAYNKSDVYGVYQLYKKMEHVYISKGD